MLVVGAPLLETYWRRRPQAEEPLRALHALLSRTPAADVEQLLAGGAPGPTGEQTVTVAGAAVSLVVNQAAGLVLIKGVEDER